jgi:hypothetical protein
VALRVGAEARLGVGVWRNVFGWQRVARLTLAARRAATRTRTQPPVGGER